MSVPKTLVVAIAMSVAATDAFGQVVPPRRALGQAGPAPGDAAFYATPVQATRHHGANCSPSRVSTMFSSAIRTGAARVWEMRNGADTYAVIWRRGHESYRAVQLVESRSGKVAQKTIGKHMYPTRQDAANAIVDHIQRGLEADAPPRFDLAGRHEHRNIAQRAPAVPTAHMRRGRS